MHRYCPHCSAAVSLPTRDSGKAVACPKCAKHFIAAPASTEELAHELDEGPSPAALFEAIADAALPSPDPWTLGPVLGAKSGGPFAAWNLRSRICG